MLTWNWLDCILALIVAASVVTSVMKGFVRELIALGSVVVGLGLAAFGYERAASWFEDIAKSQQVALGLGFLTIFLGMLLIGAFVSFIVRKLIQTVGLQWFDRLLGGVFGLLRGVLVDAVILMVLVAFAIKPEAVRGSVLAPYITTGARGVAVIMPQELKTQFHRGFERFHEELIQTDKGLGKQ
jgi:membrane protein required for colicin V production